MTTDLLDLDQVFGQLTLLTPAQFVGEAAKRSIEISLGVLEALHRAGLLQPFYRIVWEGVPGRPGRVGGGPHPKGSLQFLRAARDDGLVADPTTQPFRAWRGVRTGKRAPYGERDWFFYSHHQLIALHWIGRTFSRLRRFRRGDRDSWVLRMSDESLALWCSRGNELRLLAIALSALEPFDYPEIVRKLRSGSTFPRDDPNDYYAWRRDADVTAVHAWLNIDSQWITKTARELLDGARDVDPLGPWAEVIAHGHPDLWDGLKGRAKLAMDMRIAAEILLLSVERAERPRRRAAKATSPLPDDLYGRLRPRRSLDAALTHFGLSPHPSVVLVLEGETERYLFPRVMELFGVRTDEDFIAVQNAAGVSRDLEPLIAYAAPRLDYAKGDSHAYFTRPPTRFLVVIDPEGRMATPDQRERYRAAWIQRLTHELPRELQNDHVKRQLDDMAEAMTWNARGESFEYAHFTDQRIAQAIDALDRRPRKPTIAKLTRLVRKFRAEQGNLDHLLHGVSKIALADELWPTLAGRLVRAEKRGTADRVPIVKVLDRAIDLAHEYPRRNLLLEAERG